MPLAYDSNGTLAWADDTTGVFRYDDGSGNYTLTAAEYYQTPAPAVDPSVPTSPMPTTPIVGRGDSPWAGQVIGQWEWTPDPNDIANAGSPDYQSRGWGWYAVETNPQYIAWHNAHPDFAGGFAPTSFLTSLAVGLGLGAGVLGATGAVAAGNVATGQAASSNLGAAAVLDVAGAGVVAGTVLAGAAAAAPTVDGGATIAPVVDSGEAMPVVDASLNPVAAPALTSPPTLSFADLAPEADAGAITPAADVADVGAVTPAAGVADAAAAAPVAAAATSGGTAAAVSAGISKLVQALTPKPAPAPAPAVGAPVPVKPGAPVAPQSNSLTLLALAVLALKFL